RSCRERVPRAQEAVAKEVPQRILRTKRPSCAGRRGDRPPWRRVGIGPEPAGRNGAGRAGKVAGPVADKVFPSAYAASTSSGGNRSEGCKPDNPRTRKILSERQVGSTELNKARVRPASAARPHRLAWRRTPAKECDLLHLMKFERIGWTIVDPDGRTRD